MPLYEYQCEECGLRFEVRQKFSDAPVDVCKQCGGPARKLVSRGAFALKGGGWYDQGYSQAPSCSASSSTNEACSSCPAAKAANA
jgi:putative FmdB family regulatory protein